MGDANVRPLGYMGADRAEEYGARNSPPGELLVRVSVTRISGVRDVAM